MFIHTCTLSKLNWEILVSCDKVKTDGTTNYSSHKCIRET